MQRNEFRIPHPFDPGWMDWYLTVYLRSRYWWWRRDQYAKWISYRCEGTLADGSQCPQLGTETHHLSYAHLFAEPNGDLMLLCHGCHQRMHSWPEAANDNERLGDLFAHLNNKKTATG